MFIQVRYTHQSILFPDGFKSHTIKFITCPNLLKTSTRMVYWIPNIPQIQIISIIIIIIVYYILLDYMNTNGLVMESFLTVLRMMVTFRLPSWVGCWIVWGLRPTPSGYRRSRLRWHCGTTATACALPLPVVYCRGKINQIVHG